MANVPSEPRVVRFGVYEVDFGAGELRRKGVRVRLQEQPLQVLAILLEQPGRVITREELRRRLWADTVVDFDHGINTAIKKLRDALSDGADTPRYIETLPRRGYRFICPVNGHATAHGDPAGGALLVGGGPEGPGPVLPVLPGAAVGDSPARAHGSPHAAPRGRAIPTWVIAAAATLVLVLVGVGLQRATVGAAAITSIAVLPLRDLSPERGRDHFAAGTTEALITELGKIGALRVLAYRSVAAHRDAAKPSSRIARELGVDALLDGTVVQSGGRVRITASLIHGSSGRQLWGDSYEFDLRDVLAAQGAIAREVAGRVRVKLTPAEEARLTASRQVDPAAYEAYLLGRAHLAKAPTAESFTRAKAHLEQAIERDPGYAPAYAALGELYVRHRGVRDEHREARWEARRWGERAVERDDTLADAHAVLARSAQQDWDWERAEREFRRAIELNPSHALARIWYAMYLDAMQRFEEAAVEARRAQQLDPASAHVNTWAAATYLYAGRLDEATASVAKALELDRGFADASLVLARIHLARGRPADAIAELRRALELERHPHLVGALAHAHARAGEPREAARLVDELSRGEGKDRAYAQFGRIWAYAGLGDRERAFDALEQAYRERLGRLAWLNVDPLLAPLRTDPRFADLAGRIGLRPSRPPGPR